MKRVLREKGPFLLLAAGIWGGVAIFGGTDVSRRHVTLGYRVPAAQVERVVDVEITREGALVRRTELALGPGKDFAEHAVELGPGRYEVRAMTGTGAHALRGQDTFDVPGSDVLTIPLGGQP